MFAYSGARATESAINLTKWGHLQILSYLTGFGLLTAVFIFGVIDTLIQGYVWGRPARGQAYQIVATAANTPFAFYKTIFTFAVGAAFFGLLFAVSAIAYVYRIRLDNRRSRATREA